MLVLSRKTSEQIFIPELNITITVVKIGNSRVQLGIQAPQDVEITRPDANRPHRSDAHASDRGAARAEPETSSALLFLA
ncbi:carbon storage regulator [Fuerstiella marisgermanici]|uniref:Translational regulator CsrA n=1 Tax=Fuerstiella marisgermanici TaxID=1891926 RepID=A0A1P8W9E4_9PLAN|nr:carbon storage regulator [Fuerstiella marisgermanici]APZ90662.1 carbon storage regulator [Fuerstiella marisgermanici]